MIPLHAPFQVTCCGDRLNSRPQLDDVARAYLDACRKAEAREKGRRRALQAGLAASVVALFAAGAAYTFREPLTELATIQTKYRPFVKTTAALAGLKDLQGFQDCRAGSTDCPEMVIIPAGDFLMGERPEQTGVDEAGNPLFAPDERRKISVQRFAVSRTEITFDQWAACVDGGGCRGQTIPADSGFGRGDRPVINVSWDDAQEYAAWLSRMTGAQYRLLSEAEWEYAARGVTSASDPRNGEIWGFGDDEAQLADYAWYGTNSDGQTHPVAKKKPNRFGLFDMHGSVWEWVQDCYGDYAPSVKTAAPVEVLAEESTEKNERKCSSRVVRGGSWYDINPQNLRPAIRGNWSPVNRNNFQGFRLARTVSPSDR